MTQTPRVPTVPAAQVPLTAAAITETLTALGVAGRTVMVHTSLSRLGYVVGAEAGVVQGVVDAVGPQGTVVMPAQSWQLCDPAFLQMPDVPAEWYPVLREHLPAYDPARTPTRTMGAVAELFRTWPGVRRSAHPQRSVAALGPLAERLTAVHDLDDAAGERSPMRALHDVGGYVLLLGVGFDRCTALHLAENRIDWPTKHDVDQGGPVLRDGVRVWETWREVWPEDEDFGECGDAFCAAHPELVHRARLGAADAVLVPVRELVAFATTWLAAARGGSVLVGAQHDAGASAEPGVPSVPGEAEAAAGVPRHS